MKTYPLLTIFVLAYNSEKTIGKTLSSLLNQTYPNIEIIISDNGSTDRTEEIARDFQKKSSKIILRKNTPEKIPGKYYDGCYDNCNGCINSGMINGEFVSFFHSDDTYGKEMAEKEVEFLVKNPEAGAVFTLGNIIDKEDNLIGQRKIPKELKGKNIYGFVEIFEALLTHGNVFMVTPSFMSRTEAIKKMGVFNWKDFETSADLDMWLRILENHKIGILQENLINWRVGGGSKQYQISREERSDFFKVMDYYLKNQTGKIGKKILLQYEYQKDFDDTLLALNFFLKGEIKKAKHLIGIKSFSPGLLLAFFKNITILRIKVFILKLILVLGVNINFFQKPLKNILHKLR